jgi:hypothetical protein
MHANYFSSFQGILITFVTRFFARVFIQRNCVSLEQKLHALMSLHGAFEFIRINNRPQWYILTSDIAHIENSYRIPDSTTLLFFVNFRINIDSCVVKTFMKGKFHSKYYIVNESMQHLLSLMLFT